MAVRTYTLSAKLKADISKFYDSLDNQTKPEYNSINFYVKDDAFIIEIDSSDPTKFDAMISSLCQTDLKEAPVIAGK